ncbi:FREM1 [Cordylochernes scorpioides]|uniref:FREM1 n=1 Tax=Cordylochernes scorpioides TaxID=51811 RepID=A0ABY6LDK5_9ARAC|nr:FREM1 [Cordylochernes scorpioides]
MLQAPELHLRPLQVEEGSSALVSGAEVSATDPDTLSSDLQLSLFSVPLHGSLRRDGLALRVGDMLSLEDILGHRLDIRLGVHDGSHFVDGTLEVKVRPVDDEAPRWKEGLLRSVIVEEDGSVQITSQVYYLHDGRDGALDDRFTVAVLDRPYPDQSTAAQPRHTLAIQVQPRKSYPPVLSPQQQPALLVEEGQSVPLALTVEDRDTTDSDLTVLVVTPPHYGRLVGSLPGSEMLTSLSAFPLAEVRHRRIFYHQSHHRNVEPESDNFEVIVTDGQHNSSVAKMLVTIILRNDEEPQVSLLDLSVLEGGIVSLGENVLRVTDADFPADRLVVSVALPPQHGVLSKLVTLEDGSQAELPLESEDLHHFLRTAVYHHDGSENFQDELKLEVTDGLHPRTATARVTVVPVNDQPPRVVVNRGLSGVAPGGAALISPRYLLAADADRPPDKLVFRVMSPPVAGRLEHRTADTVWLPLLAPVFSQQQLEDNLVRYINDGKVRPGNVDGFNFTVSDGVHETEEQHFSIEVASVALTFTTNPLLVTEGTTAGINASHLVLQSFEGPVEDVIVDITGPPQLGRIERAELPGVPVRSFRFLELAGGAVIYNHTAEESGGQDMIYFIVKDSISSRNGSLLVDILTGQDYPRLVRRRLLRVAVNGTAVLSGALLQARDAAVGPEDLHYVVAEPPQHGQLLLSGRPLPEGAFTQADLDLHRLHYHHTAGTSGSDGFLFRLVNGRSTGFLVAGRITTEPARFEIEIEDPGQTTTVLLKSPTELESVGPSREPGFVLTSDHIKAVGPHAANTTYMVQPLQHTRLLIQGSPVQADFSQADIDARRVSLTILSDDATEDVLQFIPVDGAGIHLPPHRLEIHWAVLQFAYQEYEVCEDAGMVDVVVLRAGDLRGSSYGAVTAVGITATEGRDFEPATPGAAVQLGPGETSATWNLRVVDDGLEEVPVEQLQLTLQAVSGAVLGSQHVASVAIHDRVNASVNPRTCGHHNSSSYNHSPGLLHFDSQSSQLYQCDGSQWKPWPAPSPLLEPIQPCKRGWVAHSGLCHRWFRQPVSWFQAERRCRIYDSHLVAAINPHHSLWLSRQLTSHRPFWTGELPLPIEAYCDA